MEDSIISNYDNDGFHLHTIIPDKAESAKTSSGAECRLTKPVDLMEVDVEHELTVIPRDGKERHFDNSLRVTDNAAGLFKDKSINQGVMTETEGEPTYYTVSNARIGVPRNDDDYAKQYLDSRNAMHPTLPRDIMLSHADILNEVGIKCIKAGVQVAPILSTDDVRAIASKASQPSMPRSR